MLQGINGLVVKITGPLYDVNAMTAKLAMLLIFPIENSRYMAPSCSDGQKFKT